MFDLTNYSNSTSVPISHINAFLPKDKLIIFKIEIILTKDTSWNFQREMIETKQKNICKLAY
jgi:hypothetical protein